MIYTVTFNPSLDYIVTVDDFKLGLTNRTTSELMLPGGKGINVSIVLGKDVYKRQSVYISCIVTKTFCQLIECCCIRSTISSVLLESPDSIPLRIGITTRCSTRNAVISDILYTPVKTVV